MSVIMHGDHYSIVILNSWDVSGAMENVWNEDTRFHFHSFHHRAPKSEPTPPIYGICGIMLNGHPTPYRRLDIAHTVHYTHVVAAHAP